MLARRVVATLGVTLGVSPVVYAQIDDRQLPCEAFSQSAAVFVGVAGRQVVRVVEVPNQPPFELKVTPVVVERAYLSVTNAIMWVTPLSIDEPARTGQKYLVYGREYSAPGIVMASPGIGAKEIETAAVDLAFLEALPPDAVGGTIFGIVQEKEKTYAGGMRIRRPLDGIKVEIIGATVRTEVVTDAHGRFVAAGLPTGHYELIPRLPHELITWDSTSKITLAVRDGGCATKTIDAVVNGTVRGVLLGPDGHALTSASVDVVPMDNKPDRVSGQISGMGSVWTNDRGEFEFAGLPAGRYYLGVSLYNAPNPFGRSHPRTYYPGTTDRDGAVPVVVEHGATSASFNFSIPYILSKGEVAVLVDTGDVIGETTRCFVQLDDLVSRRSIYDMKPGVAMVMPVVEGSRYHLHAHLKNSAGHLESEPYEFTATTGRETVSLRPDSPRTLHR